MTANLPAISGVGPEATLEAIRRFSTKVVSRMYVPLSFQISESEKLIAFMRDHSFATLVSCEGAVPVASHLPLRRCQSDDNQITLHGHMARANPQWKHFDSKSELLVIFQGPHSYISPTWYIDQPFVPTWNYTAIHAYGTPSILSDKARVVALLDETVEFYEQGFNSTSSGELPVAERDALIEAIVAFEIKVTRIEGNYKLGQNRSLEDRQRVHDALMVSSDPNAVELAKLMKTECFDCDEQTAGKTEEGKQGT